MLFYLGNLPIVVLHKFHDKLMKNIFIESIFIDESFTYLFYLLANEVAKGYSNATFRPSITSL